MSGSESSWKRSQTTETFHRSVITNVREEEEEGEEEEEEEEEVLVFIFIVTLWIIITADLTL